MKKHIPLLLSSFIAATLFVGCSSSDTASDTTSTVTGQLVDSYVANVEYSCADEVDGITDINGTFSCAKLPITFSIGGLQLGTLTTLPSDTQVFPQDLIGVARTDLNNTEVLAMARFLQSCDEDNNTGNGIQVQARVRDAFADYNTTFNTDDIQSYADEAGITLIDENTTLTHLSNTTTLVEAIESVVKLPQSVKDALLTPQNTLTQDVKDTIAFMGNEERLAYDVYNKLYESFPTLTQFNKIATNSEYTHIQSVQLLAQKYINTSSDLSNLDANISTNIGVAIEDMNSGMYDIVELQNLYDALVVIGEASQEAALKVGCMVEVTDIDDLLRNIELSKDSNASDVTAVFEFLRDGSYSHYWSFDNALKGIGVADGCCDIGVIDGIDYCHNEYPQIQHGRR